MQKKIICLSVLVLLLGVHQVWAVEGDTLLISKNSAGSPANDGSFAPAISAKGRYVAFSSDATDLVTGDTNVRLDVFLHDTQSDDITRVSVDSADDQANDSSYAPAISADGRYVAFHSDATDLVTGDTNESTDIFVHDTQTGNTIRVSVDSAGSQADAESLDPAISADGRYVAFRSRANNLVSGDTNGDDDIFVHDTQTGDTTHVSVDSTGTHANDDSDGPAISADGRYVVFHSDATNLVSGDTNFSADIFVHDTQTGDTTRASVDSAGNQGTAGSLDPAISADGRYVAFRSIAPNLTPGDTNLYRDIFVHDTQTGNTTRVSVDSAGSEANGDSFDPAISANGRYVTYFSYATNLVPGDTNGRTDIFIHDTQTGNTTRVSVDSAGSQANDDSDSSAMSADGKYVTYFSNATNLVPGDINGAGDVFIHQFLPDADTSDGGGGGGCFIDSAVLK